MTLFATSNAKINLDIRDMSIRRGERTILKSVNLSAASGDVIILRGDNGAGKTTFLRTLAGLLPLENTSVSLTKNDAHISASDIRAYVFFLGHKNGVDDALTVKENLQFWAKLYGVSNDKVTLAAQAVNLEDALSRPAHILSAGQKRRLALGRAVLSGKPIWLLDEPSAALDKASRERVTHLIDAHSQAGGIALIATHDRFPVSAARTFSLTAA